MDKDLFLVLENGKSFRGKSFGYEAQAQGEVVFTTAVTGYLETLCDKNYSGQIVVQTFPLIGNYGVIEEDISNKQLYPSGYVVRDFCLEPSNFRSKGSIDELLRENKVTGLYGIDTRALTRYIRQNGVMRGKLVFDKDSTIDFASEKDVLNDFDSTSTKHSYSINAYGEKYKIAIIDLGLDESIITQLQRRGCSLQILPHNASVQQINELEVDGVVISDGAGDPTQREQLIKTIKKLCEQNMPILGIGLAHQVLALSQNFKVKKLKYGHRGQNQPVRSNKSGRVYITSQNHGFVVESESVDKKAQITYVNANDGTCEGLSYSNIPALSTQFCPQASQDVHDTSHIYDRFLALIKK